MRKILGVSTVFLTVLAACGTSSSETDGTRASATTVPDTGGSVVTSVPGTTPDVPATTVVIEPTAARLAPDPDAPTAEWVAGVNAAGWDFHRFLAGNAVSSPLSIGTAFSLARAGASPDTGTTLDEIFGFPGTGTHDAANAVDLRVSEASVEPTTLEVANRLFPNVTFTPLPEFVDIASAQYGAAIQPIETSDGATAAGEINGWVSDTTRGLIPEIVNAGIVQGQELFLVNTVYLKADWRDQFLPELTMDDEFSTGDGSVTVPFMRDRVPVERRFVRLDAADAVELPYEGGELSMWLIVPRDIDGLDTVEETLDAATLTALDVNAEPGMVELTMPKWEQTLPPTDLLEWTCPSGFCAGAPFGGIAPGIFVTSALHGAKVIVDEKGTEAAAATAIGFDESGPPPPDLTVVADHPFLWAIVHEDTGAVLFVGRLTDPTGS